MPLFDFQDVYRQIIENASDAVLFADREGKIRVWNRGAERIFGFAASEALGQSLDMIIPEAQRERHWQGYFRVMDGAPSRYGTQPLNVPALHKSGARISCEFTIQMVRDEEDAVLGIAAILRDVSARREQELELRRRLAECEGRNSA